MALDDFNVTAYAVSIDGKIDPQTVSISRIGAIVNWAYKYRHTSIPNDAEESAIFEYWATKRTANEQCVFIELVEMGIEIGNANAKG